MFALLSGREKKQQLKFAVRANPDRPSHITLALDVGWRSGWSKGVRPCAELWNKVCVLVCLCVPVRLCVCVCL